MARDLLEHHPDLRGIYNVGSGNRGIEKALLETGREHDITYVAFNLTPLTRQALVTGVMNAVVHQDMAHAARGAITTLLDALVGKPTSLPNVPIEIIMRENLR